jgi:membrane associated rhomboid family serine protease
MIILPYSTALTLARPPTVTYIIIALCCVIFVLQNNFPITESLMYYPDTWNPLTMITSSLVHGDLMHLLGNMIFFFAFAPALELLVGSKLRYITILLFITFVVGISDSISFLIGDSESIPTLGFSGVMMGMIGLSAYLMPMARIRVFWWYIVFWKFFFAPAWLLAIIYIGLETWTMLTADFYDGIDVVAHVTGGLAGYLYGYLWLKERKEETREELADEIEEIKIEQQFGRSKSMSFRGRKGLDQQRLIRETAKSHDKFMRSIHQRVTTHRDSEAILMLMDEYDHLLTSIQEFEALFERINEWGPSRTLLCVGRLIIDKLDQENRSGRAVVYIEKCQKASPQFILPDVSRTIFYAKFSIEAGKLEVARNLIANPEKRYSVLVDREMCTQLTNTLASLGV